MFAQWRPMKFRNIITNPVLRLETRALRVRFLRPNTVSRNQCMESEKAAIMCRRGAVRRDGGKGEISCSY